MSSHAVPSRRYPGDGVLPEAGEPQSERPAACSRARSPHGRPAVRGARREPRYCETKACESTIASSPTAAASVSAKTNLQQGRPTYPEQCLLLAAAIRAGRRGRKRNQESKDDAGNSEKEKQHPGIERARTHAVEPCGKIVGDDGAAATLALRLFAIRSAVRR